MEKPMFKYEELKHKADLCRIASAKTNGYMSVVWEHKAEQLEDEADKMTLLKAQERGTKCL